MIKMIGVKRKDTSDNEPRYYICARRDNGFIAAYRAYFYFHGDTVKKVGKFRYERSVIFKKTADAYKPFSPKYFVFNIKAKSNDPVDWKIKQSEYEKDRYDVNDLIALLKKTEIMLKGYIQLVLHEFDGYQIIHMVRTSEETHGLHLGEQSLLFRDGKPVAIGKKINFGSVRDFHRLEKDEARQ